MKRAGDLFLVDPYLNFFGKNPAITSAKSEIVQASNKNQSSFLLDFQQLRSFDMKS